MPIFQLKHLNSSPLVVAIAPYTGDRVLKRVLKLSIYRLQTFLLKYNYVKTNAYVESLNICSQMCACDPCNLGTHQLIFGGGGLWNLYGVRIFCSEIVQYIYFKGA